MTNDALIHQQVTARAQHGTGTKPEAPPTSWWVGDPATFSQRQAAELPRMLMSTMASTIRPIVVGAITEKSAKISGAHGC